MLNEKLKGHLIILASGSPRRQEFFKAMGLDFEIRLKAVEEIYPPELKRSEISDFLSKLKASAFEGTLNAKDILVTSDTIVWHQDTCLGKPTDERAACSMLHTLSNDWHEVITSVSMTTATKQNTVHSITRVKLKPLTEDEILHYVTTYNPIDKAGGYGIQEWIGLIGIEEIQGSYTNVVGLPTHLVYKMLMQIVD